VIDLRTGCFGMAQSVSIAQRFLWAEDCEHVLVVGSELFSPLLYGALSNRSRFRPRQRTMLEVTTALFGDAAGALVLGRAGAQPAGLRILDCRTHSIGVGRRPGMLGVIGGAKTFDCEHGNADVMVHDWEAIAAFFREMGERLFDSFDEPGQVALDDVALIVPAQANGRIRDVFAELVTARYGEGPRAQRARGKVFVDVENVGNTGAASIYVALDKIRRSGLVAPGQTILAVPGEATKWFYGTIVIGT
jgi:3-oxoacyl-[acyl-carrier-protein] synthase-3